MENQTFTKKDLKTGMLIEFRDGTQAFILLDTPNGNIFSSPKDFEKRNWGNMDSSGSFHGINENLTWGSETNPTHRFADIIKVYGTCHNMSFLFPNGIETKRKLLFERK